MTAVHQAELDFLETLNAWLTAGRRVLLATIIATKGHTPRRIGSQFALRDDGMFVGSVSGGCAEDDLIAALLNEFPSAPTTVFYGGQRNHARQALACGGEIELALEPLKQCHDFAAIIDHINAGRCINRSLHLDSGESRVATAEDDTAFSLERPWLTLRYGSSWRLFIIGAVEIAHHLIPIAQMLNYRIGMCDPRPAYQKAWRLDAIAVNSQYPDDWLRDQAIDAQCAIVALSHDPRVDDMALMAALPSKAFYVGALGSKRSTEKRLERLKQLDLTPDQIDRLHGPIGLDIGSRSAAEIAVAIMAQLVAVRSEKAQHA